MITAKAPEGKLPPDAYGYFAAAYKLIVALWIVVFLHTGRSSVTESRVSLYVLRHKT